MVEDEAVLGIAHFEPLATHCPVRVKSDEA
jgi:hypothetical protein